MTHENEVKDCFKDADVYKKFTALPEEEQEHVLKDILSQHDEDNQEKKIVAYIKKLFAKT